MADDPNNINGINKESLETSKQMLKITKDLVGSSGDLSKVLDNIASSKRDSAKLDEISSDFPNLTASCSAPSKSPLISLL